MEKPLILEADRAAALQRIQELEQCLLDMAEEINEAVTQSSETWHDNAAFEVLRDKRTMYHNDIAALRAVLANATRVMPRAKRGVIGVACTVELQDAQTLKRIAYFITGDWTLRAGELQDGALIISRQSPLGALLIGKKVGVTIRFNGVDYIVTSVAGD